MPIYIDESGYTGQHLSDQNQPVFVLASNDFQDDECFQIMSTVGFAPTPNELKHSRIAARNGGRKKVVRLIEAFQAHPGRVTAYVVHKEFALLTLLADLWIESAWKKIGLDFYDQGFNLAFCTRAYFGLRTFESPQFLRTLLWRFEIMMTRRDQSSYQQFWNYIRNSITACKSESQEILEYFLEAEGILGPGELERMGNYPLDLALTMLLQTSQYWSQRLPEGIELIHDESTNLAQQRWIWDQIVRPNLPQILVDSHDGAQTFPPKVTSTSFARSEDHLQLQMSDLVAGAVSVVGRSAAGSPSNPPYCEALRNAGIPYLLIGGIWPTIDVDQRPLTPGTVSQQGVIDYLSSHLKLKK